MKICDLINPETNSYIQIQSKTELFSLKNRENISKMKNKWNKVSTSSQKFRKLR